MAEPATANATAPAGTTAGNIVSDAIGALATAAGSWRGVIVFGMLLIFMLAYSQKGPFVPAPAMQPAPTPAADKQQDRSAELLAIGALTQKVDALKAAVEQGQAWKAEVKP